MRFSSLLSLLLAIGASSDPTAAQDLTGKAPAQTRPVFLFNGTIHPMSRPAVVGGGLLFENGRIAAIVEAGVEPGLGEDTEKIDLKGSHVYPGLVTARTSLGLAEIGSVPMSIDTTEIGEVTPEVRANVAVNPDSTAIPVARSNGILTAGVFPSGGLISGRASVMTTDGWTWKDMTLRADAGLVIQWPRRDHQKTATRLDEIVSAARSWIAARAADPDIPIDLRWQSMAPALARQTKTFLFANDLQSITTAVEWAVRNRLLPVIIGGRDSYLCTDLLKRHRVEVVVSGTHTVPKRRDSPIDERFRLPLQLHRAGVLWCLGSGGSFANERNLPYHAASAVAYGLPEMEAMRAITTYAARTLGVEARVGSLQPGRDATLMVTTGSPLDLTTVIEIAFIQGRRVQLHNKQRALAAKYREKYRQLRAATPTPDKR